MAVNESSVKDQMSTDDQHLPPIIIHRTPSASFPPLTNLLKNHFRLLDPHLSTLPLHSFYSRHAHFVRALVVVELTPVTEDTLHHLPSLKLIVASSTGTDHVDMSACRLRGIAVTNAGNAFTEDVADFAIALLFGVLRRISDADKYVRSEL